MRDLQLPDPETIRERFGNKPIQLMRIIDPSFRFPKKIKTIFAHLWLQTNEKGEPCSRFIMKGPRGGGKSKVLGGVGFCKWYLQELNIVDMGGNLEQAKVVYNYFANHCYSHHTIVDNLPKEPMMQMTVSDLGNYFKAVAASFKQIRGPHPDVLFGDEVCETKDELILAALPMVNTSDRQLIVLTSTFHKVFGIFQEIWDDAERLGYMRFSWDIFDVCRPFDPKIWDDKTLNREIHDLAGLKTRAKGRVGEPEGWVPIGNIIQAWREKPDLNWFDVEYMGLRPATSGLVLNPEDVEAAAFEGNKYPWQEGAETVLGIDWGFSSMTSIVELMKHINAVKVQLWNKNFSQVDLDVIIEYVVERVILHKIRWIYADSSGKFENSALQNALNIELPKRSLRNHKCKVIEVVFSKEKVEMLGNYRSHFARKKIKIPADEREAIWQHKRYHYVKGTDKPVKKDDHIPDATMCALQHFPLKRVTRGIDKANVDPAKHGSQHQSIASSLYHERF